MNRCVVFSFNVCINIGSLFQIKPNTIVISDNTRMAKVYKKKRRESPDRLDRIRRAKFDIKWKWLSRRQAGKMYRIPEATLRRHCRKQPVAPPGRPTVLSSREEETIRDHLKVVCLLFHSGFLD